MHLGFLVKWYTGENCVKFLFRELGGLTTVLHCNSQRKALMNTVVSYDDPNWLERTEDKSKV